MPKYVYDATDQSGHLVSATVDASSLADATAELQSQGLTVMSIRLEGHPTNVSVLDQRLQDSINGRESLVPKISAFLDEFSVVEQKRADFHTLVSTLKSNVNVSQIKSDFPAFVPLLVGAGVSDKQLATSLEDLAVENHSRSSLRMALAYPAMLWVFAFVILVGLCIYVVPIFAEIFADFGMQLPLATRTLLDLSAWVTEGTASFVATVVAVTLGIALAIYGWRSKNLSQRFFGFALPTKHSKELATLTGHLASLTIAGVPVRESIPVVAGICEDKKLAANALLLVGGGSGHQTLAFNSLPPNVIHAIGMGESQIAPNARLLRELSEIYRHEIFRHGNLINGLLLGLSMIGIGLMVGVIVLGLFAPLISLVAGLS